MKKYDPTNRDLEENEMKSEEGGGKLIDSKQKKNEENRTKEDLGENEITSVTQSTTKTANTEENSQEKPKHFLSFPLNYITSKRKYSRPVVENESSSSKLQDQRSDIESATTVFSSR